MSDFTISIFGNKTLFLIINEIKSFSKFKVKYWQDMHIFNDKENKAKNLAVFFLTPENKENILTKIKNGNILSLVVSENCSLIKNLPDYVSDKLLMPFTIFSFEKKVINLIAKEEFKKNSFINLGLYIIDKNERKIKKDNLELQLSEKEVNFLILFSKNKEPISTNFILKNAWKYSLESETHTVETHIHRLRKKIFSEFGDDNFIKNNSKGYFV